MTIFGTNDKEKGVSVNDQLPEPNDEDSGFDFRNADDEEREEEFEAFRDDFDLLIDEMDARDEQDALYRNDDYCPCPVCMGEVIEEEVVATISDGDRFISLTLEDIDAMFAAEEEQMEELAENVPFTGHMSHARYSFALDEKVATPRTSRRMMHADFNRHNIYECGAYGPLRRNAETRSHHKRTAHRYLVASRRRGAADRFAVAEMMRESSEKRFVHNRIWEEWSDLGLRIEPDPVVITLSGDDFDHFVRALENPALPNAALMRAARRYEEFVDTSMVEEQEFWDRIQKSDSFADDEFYQIRIEEDNQRMLYGDMIADKNEELRSQPWYREEGRLAGENGEWHPSHDAMQDALFADLSHDPYDDDWPEEDDHDNGLPYDEDVGDPLKTKTHYRENYVDPDACPHRVR